jgi:aspartate carbamoyltransferase regulatory subunit
MEYGREWPYSKKWWYKMSKRDMLVSAIKDGTVIDRIPTSRSSFIVSLLHLNEDLDCTVAIAMRVPSQKMGKKDVIKIQGRYLTDQEIRGLGIIAPGVTVTYVKNYEIDKKFIVDIPEEIEGILVCNNPTCATNYREPVIPKFTIMQKSPLLVRCKYCDRVMLEENVLSQFHY